MNSVGVRGLIAISVALGLMAGCSDDETLTNPPTSESDNEKRAQPSAPPSSDTRPSPSSSPTRTLSDPDSSGLLATTVLITERGYRYGLTLSEISSVRFLDDPGFVNLQQKFDVTAVNELSDRPTPEVLFLIKAYYDLSGLPSRSEQRRNGVILGSDHCEFIQQQTLVESWDFEIVQGDEYCVNRMAMLGNSQGRLLEPGQRIELTTAFKGLGEPVNVNLVREEQVSGASDLLGAPHYVAFGVNENNSEITWSDPIAIN